MSLWDWFYLTWLWGGALMVGATDDVLRRHGDPRGLDWSECLIGVVVWPLIVLGYAAGWLLRRWI